MSRHILTTRQQLQHAVALSPPGWRPRSAASAGHSHQDLSGGTPFRLPRASGAHGTKLSLHQPFCSGVGVDGQRGPHPRCFPGACAHPWLRWPMNPPWGDKQKRCSAKGSSKLGHICSILVLFLFLRMLQVLLHCVQTWNFPDYNTNGKFSKNNVPRSVLSFKS